MPATETAEQREQFLAVVRESVGAILRLQEQAEEMISRAIESRSDSPLRTSLSPEQQNVWDQLRQTRIITQRWSDGIVAFVSLGDQEIKCPMNGIFSLLGLAGTLCFLGLATKHPVRGGIEIAWGVELRPGELYGPVVARAYELESEVAGYPRMVVGPEMLKYLRFHAANQESDHFSALNRELAKLCLEMLLLDTDGFAIVHYLGEQFRDAISQAHHGELFDEAGKYVAEQLKRYRENGDSKLAIRYSLLAHYFAAHAPIALTQGRLPSSLTPE